MKEIGFGESDILKEKFLRADELFLLEFLKGFDRRTNKEWNDLGLLNNS